MQCVYELSVPQCTKYPEEEKSGRAGVARRVPGSLPGEKRVVLLGSLEILILDFATFP